MPELTLTFDLLVLVAARLLDFGSVVGLVLVDVPFLLLLIRFGRISVNPERKPSHYRTSLD
jgi:hypothetical protein